MGTIEYTSNGRRFRQVTSDDGFGIGQPPQDLGPDDSLAAKDREIARLREALERILPRSIANSNDDLNECKRQMMHIAALARAALAQDGRE